MHRIASQGLSGAIVYMAGGYMSKLQEVVSSIFNGNTNISKSITVGELVRMIEQGEL